MGSSPGSDCQCREGDWHNVSDPKTRRKIQNRQNQRARRLRNAKAGDGPVVKLWTPGPKGGRFVHAFSTPKIGSCTKRSTLEPTSKRIFSATTLQHVKLIESVDRKTLNDCTSPCLPLFHSAKDLFGDTWYGPEEAYDLDSTKRLFTSHEAKHRGLHNDRLLTLVYYNVFRGMTWNMEILGLDTSRVGRSDYVSPFVSTKSANSSLTTKLPACLQPTYSQTHIPHHPGYDAFPCSTIRDNMLRRGMTKEEELEFFLDAHGFNRDTRNIGTSDSARISFEEGDRSGLSLWGDPWDVESWEMSEYLSKKYPWIVVGAFALQIHTNARRRARGWKELCFA